MKTESCREWRESLGAYALGQLPDEERAGLEAHLEGCPECRAELDSLACVSRGCCRSPTPSASAPRPRRRPRSPTGSPRRSAPSGGRQRRRRLRLGLALERRDRGGGRSGAGDLRPARRRRPGRPSSTSPSARCRPGMKIAATLEPHAFGTEIHMYVKGVRSGTLCRVFLRGPDGARLRRLLPLPLGRRRGGGAQLGARPLQRPRRSASGPATATFVAPVGNSEPAGNQPDHTEPRRTAT